MKYEYVIIGNSAAAAGCIEGIRETDKKGTVAVISDEKYHIYSRPLISYRLKGDVTEKQMNYRPADFYKVNNVETLLGKRAVSVDSKTKIVQLETGEKIEYEKLLLATGSKPFVPPMDGLDSVRNRFCFMKMDDVKGIEKVVKKGAKVLIIGAGLIGLKAAEALEHYDCEMTVIDLADRILPSILDKKTSEIMRKHIEAHGVKFILGTSAKSFKNNVVTLTNGEEIKFDILITAVGVRPNTELAESAGAKVERGQRDAAPNSVSGKAEPADNCLAARSNSIHARGFITDKKQAVKGVKNIWAAGDCTVSEDITTGTSHIIAIMPNAYAQGLVAGRNMSGNKDTFDKAFPMNAIGFFGLHIITAGAYVGDCYEENDGENVKQLFSSDNKLNGFILMGDKIKRAGIYTALIRERTDLTTVDYKLLCEAPQLAAFAREKRFDILSKGA
ncbi:MAG: NAD(P)/FAD-dependent oxidoreductase [Ruminiclostridium sp.]|nr:NAD(P)/FAD-dependent oxidoreductase [Ruminiclostridium sp.]